MKVGDLVRNKRHPQAGIGIIIELFHMKPGYQGRHSSALAVFPEHGAQIVYRDEAEVVSDCYRVMPNDVKGNEL